MNAIELIKEYPFLEINKECTKEDYTWLDEFEPGWEVAFGLDFCKELKEALIEDDMLEEFKFAEIKEKWGMLDIFVSRVGANAEKVIRKYEELSQYYCAHCGKPARFVYTNYVWPACEDCIRAFDHGIYKTIEQFYGFDSYDAVESERNYIWNL